MSARNGNGRGRGIDASIWGISDTELLARVDDVARASEDGWASALDVRLALGENVDRVKHSGVGQRLAWSVRYGWLERHPDERLWRLTQDGKDLLGGELTDTFERAFGRLTTAQRVQLTRELGEVGQGSSPALRSALRRQWARSLGRWA
jgi:hypothetical protein